VEQQIVDFHSGKVGAIPGTSPMQAVNAFLKKAVTLDTYGIDPHPVKVSGHLSTLPVPIGPERPAAPRTVPAASGLLMGNQLIWASVAVVAGEKKSKRKRRLTDRNPEALGCTSGRTTAALPHFKTAGGRTIFDGPKSPNSITRAKCSSFISSSWR